MYPALIFIPRQEQSSRLYLLLRPFMIVPHVLFSMLYGLCAMFILILAYWSIILTGIHRSFTWSFLVRFHRYASNVAAYMSLLTDTYPPFHGGFTADFPIQIRMEYPARYSRLNAMFRSILLLPVVVYGLLYATMMQIILFICFWVVLLAGRIPEALWDLLKRYQVFACRVNAYALLLVDEYPPFHGVQPAAANEMFLSPPHADVGHV